MNTIPVQQRKIQWKISLPEDIWNHIFLNYCDFDSIVTTRMLQSRYVKQCTQEKDFKLAIEANNVSNVKWIYQCGKVELKEIHFNAAAKCGALSIMKWLKSNECPLDYYSSAFQYAAQYGNLENMIWLKANDCPWDSYTFRCTAASNTNLEKMIWLKENGSPWDAETCYFAAKNGNLRNMMWLKKNGCPWDADLRFIVYCMATTVILALLFAIHPWP